MKKPLFIALIVLLAAVLLVSGFQLWRYSKAENDTKQQFDGLSSQVRTPAPSASQGPAQSDGISLPADAGCDWTVYDQYGALFAENADMIGWISIDGTAVNYPVMQSPDRPDFYLHHNFERQSSNSGVPYVNEDCSFDPQSDNITVYSHHMKSGSMFGALDGYKLESFWREHPTIRFDTFAGFGTYEIIAVFKVNPTDFQYNLFINAADEAEFDAYVRRCGELSLYDTGLTASYGDKLLTLSTCEYSQPNNRLVVVAKKIL